LPVTRIAYASGFQSLRRFNSAFRERYRLSPSALRPRPRSGRRETDLVRLTLAYRAPLAWDPLIAFLERSALPGVEVIEERAYGRTIELDGLSGVVFASDAPEQTHLNIDLSPSLLPVLMPLLVRLRHLFDLDAEPTVIDAHLTEGGLGALVSRHRGLRTPGVVDGFDAVLSALLLGWERWGDVARESARRVVAAFGATVDTGSPVLTRLAPTPQRIAAAGPARGVPPRRASALAAVARAMSDGTLRLEPGSDIEAAKRGLLAIEGIGDRCTTTIVMRALYWPDAFPASDPALRRAAAVSNPRELHARAERWRPWRAYAAMHLRMAGGLPLQHE
jgi:AraC family transcriptional regulator of adaptative response / DNA-3-methyladenine glycosylase II